MQLNLHVFGRYKESTSSMLLNVLSSMLLDVLSLYQKDSRQLWPTLIGLLGLWLVYSHNNINLPISMNIYFQVRLSTHMSIGNIKQVFDPTAFINMKFITNVFLYNHIVSLLWGQNLINFFCRFHSIHLVGLQKMRETVYPDVSENAYWCLIT